VSRLEPAAGMASSERRRTKLHTSAMLLALEDGERTMRRVRWTNDGASFVGPRRATAPWCASSGSRRGPSHSGPSGSTSMFTSRPPGAGLETPRSTHFAKIVLLLRLDMTM
jgi:hypothetical protein